jgi:TP901 family phage tail tape measure protein
MADINSNIKVNIDTSDALAQLKLLQQQISAFQQAMRNAGAQNASAAAAMQQNLITSINATGKFRANVQTIKTSAESFTESLEKNKFSIGEYFRYAGGASKTFGKLFKSEYATITQVAKERVKELQTQYIKLGRDANGAMKAIAVKPLSLDMTNLATKTQIAAQKQQLFNQLMTQGSTSLLNFGKNTQWAGRQLMVGFTIPLTLMGSAASKAYMQIEAASVKFRRVYGDMNTTTEEANKMVKSVQSLANEFTKYGVAVADTMDMAAQAAAMGKTGADLIAQINNAAKLSILGGVDQNKALETTISLTNAFGVAAEDLGKNIDFLNAVENQTTLSIDDLTTAIPKAAPVVRQLGGDVKDLAFFMTAMKEGGINASEGANAIKSGLASLINPSEKASKFLQGFGINVKGIVEADKGNLKKTVVDFAKALDTLDPLNRARAIEQMFGKFQFSRLSTLFQNVIAEGSQASQVAELSKNSAEELAILSEREMKKISDSPMFKFQKSMQDMQAKLAPVGEAFLKAITPIIEFVSKILDGFNNLGEGTKNFVSMLVLAVAGIGPILLMTFGLIANGVANIMKLFTNMKGFINKTTKPSDILGEQTQYMTTEQLRGAAVAASLDQAHVKLRQTFTSEKAALDELTRSYRQAVEAQQQYSGVPGIPTGNPNAVPKRYANGVSMVPGPRGAGDIVPALLSPGEAVIPAKHAQKYAPVIAGMVAGNLPGFESGTTGVGMRQSTIGPLTQKQTEGILRTGKTLKEISDEVYAGPYGKVPAEHYVRQIEPTSGHSFPAFQVGGIYEKADGSQVFVKPQMDLTSALAEIRGTQIARDAHQLTTPMQKIVAMMDPTDPEGMRKFIALESPLNEQIAKMSTSFTKGQYFKQLVASLLRGDKDLGIGNLGGDILADVGTAGVFQTASGKRKLGGSINSMEEQAIINLLGVKGGAKRFFAESTSDIASKMSPAEYSASMKAEIQAVMPRLQATIASFGNLSPEEKAAYANMQQRLQAGMGVDWGKYQVMHSAVKPKSYNLGTPGIGLEKSILAQESHLQGAMDVNDPQVFAQLQKVYGPNVTPEQFKDFEILGNLTMTLPGKVNQMLKNGGMQSANFLMAYNSLRGKLSKTALRAGVKDLNASQTIEDMIGTSAAKVPMVTDPSLALASKNTLSEASIINGPIGAAAILIFERMKQVGTLRSKFDNVDGLSQQEIILGMLKRKEVAFNATGTSIDTPFGARLGRWNMDPFGSSKGTAEDLAIRKQAQEASRAWALAGNFDAPMPTIMDSSGKLRTMGLRSNSAKPGAIGDALGIVGYDKSKKGFEGNLSLSSNGAKGLSETLGIKIPGFAKGGIISGYANGMANVGPTGKPKASVFDIDDTLLDLSGWMENFKAENDKLPEGQKKKWYKEVAKDPKGLTAGINALKAAQIRGNKILLMTARPTVNDPYTLETLQKLGIDMNGVKLISRRDKDYRKPEQMKYDKTSAYMKYYDIEEFYDDMPKTRGAVSLLGINAINPLKLAGGTTGVLPQGFSAMPTQAEKDAQIAFIQNSPLAQLQRGDALASLVSKSTIGKGNQMFRVPTIRQNEELATKKVGDIIDIGNRFTSIADQSQLQAIGMTAAGKLNTGNRERAVNTILKLVAGYDMPGIMNHSSYNPDYKKQAFGEKAGAEYPFQSEGVLPPGLKGKITGISNGIPKIIEVLIMQLAKGGFIPGYSGGTPGAVPAPQEALLSRLGQYRSQVIGSDTYSNEAGTVAYKDRSLTKYESVLKLHRDGQYTEAYKTAMDLFEYLASIDEKRVVHPGLQKNGLKMEQVYPDLYAYEDAIAAFKKGGGTEKVIEWEETLPIELAKGGIIPGYAKGVFSVPGPKGAGDVVPAMLSPGEAVIPADRAAQHRGLIKGMIAGNLPGYAKGTIIPGYKYGKDNVPGNVPGGGFFSADSESLVLEQSKVVALEEALVAKKENVTRLTREQIQEQMSLEDDSYRLLLEEQQKLKMKAVLTEEERKQLQKNDEQILQKEEIFKNDKNVEEKKQSGLSKLFTRSKFTGRVQGAMYGATAAAGAVSAMGGPIGEAAGAALPAIGAMTGAMSMIPGPAGMVVGGLMAVVAISAQLDAHFKALRDAAAKSTTAMGASVEAMKKLSEFAKTVGSREIMDKRRADAGTGLFYVKPGKQTFGESYMQSESGKELATATTDAIRVGDVKAAAALVTSQMGTAIASGILSPEQARSVVANLAKQIKSTSFAININAKISSLFGPDGTPLTVAKNSIKLSMDALNVVVGNKPGKYDDANQAAAGGGAVNSAMLAALNTIQTNLDAIALNPKSTPEEIAAATAAAQTATEQVYTTTEVQAGTNRNNVAAAARDAANAKYKDTSDAKLVEELVNTIQNKNLTTRYEYNDKTEKYDKKVTTGISDTEEIFLTNMITSGIISPTNMKTATNMNINGADLVPLLKTNAKATDTLLGIAGSSGKTPEEQLAFIQKQKGLSSKELGARASALTTTGATTGAYFMDDTSKKKISDYYESDTLVKGDTATGIEKAKKIDKQYKALQGKKTITLETVLKTVGTNPLMENALKSGDFNKYFSKLKDKKNKVIFTTQFNSLMNLGTPELAGPIKAWLSEKGRMSELMNFRGNDADIVSHFRVEYSAYEANRVTEAGTMVDNTVNPEGNNNEPAAKESSWLDQYVKTARDAGKATQALTTGFADSGAALKKFGAAAPKLNGLFTQLKAAGASNDIIQAALGGDEATTKALIDVKTGKLKAGAKQILAGINLAIRQQKEIDWLGLTSAEKKQKYNDMYNADLEVLKISEDEINKRYDDRIKALDTINTLNERNSAQQQSTLTLADALAKGDIAAAARAALEKRKQDTSFALEDQKKNLELARTLELSKLVVDINGVQMTRAEVEEKIRINAEAITKAKATELELGIRIGQLAEREYSAVVNPVKKATGGLIMPKGYAYGGGIYGTDTVPAMLTPGEFVVKKSAVDAIGIDKLNTINSGNMPSDSVYNYSINVNVATGADANDIARTVMTQIRQTESQRVRSNTY